jgi:hypothetical protein
MIDKPHLKVGRQLGLALLAVTAVFAGTAAADPPARVGRLNFIEGSVSLRPASVEEWAEASINRPLTTGDHIWTDSRSRAEIHVGSTAIRLGPETDFDLLNLDDHTEQIRLAQGSLNIHIRYLDEDSVFEVDTPNAAISLLRTGVYRIDVVNDGDESRVTVRHGEAEVTTEGSAFAVRPYQTALVDGDESITYDVREAIASDNWDDWCQRRDSREDHPVSARYVSTEMVGYEDLDSYGTWRTDADYGPIWVPSRVVVGWAPYHYGHWAWVYPWGWTWVDDAPWGFAPFHYGRWAYVGGVWGWVPGAVLVQRPVYAPALVAFVGGGGFSVSLNLGGGGGIGWFPLGPREAYYPAYRVSDVYVRNVNVTNVNVTNINVRNINVTNVRYVNRTVPGAVTAVPQAAFVSSRSVSAVAVRVPQGAIASAQVSGMTAPVAPTKVSVVAVAAGGPASAPPVTVMNRKVRVKETPPAPVVPFVARQKDLAAHPGVPEDPAVLAEYHKKDKTQNALVKSAVVPTGGTPKIKPARAGITAAAAVSGNAGKTGGQTSTQTGTQTTGQSGEVVKDKNKSKGQGAATGADTTAEGGKEGKDKKGAGTTQSGQNTTSGEVDKRKTTADSETGKPPKEKRRVGDSSTQPGGTTKPNKTDAAASGQSGQTGEQGQGKNKNKGAAATTTTGASTPPPKVKEEKPAKTGDGGQSGEGGQKNKENKNKENKNKQKPKEGEKPNGEKQGGR